MPEVALDILSVGEDTGVLANSMNDVTEGFKEELDNAPIATPRVRLPLDLLWMVTIAIGIVTSALRPQDPTTTTPPKNYPRW